MTTLSPWDRVVVGPLRPGPRKALIVADFHVDLVSVPGLEALTLAEHHQILDAIASGDAEAAARLHRPMRAPWTL